MKIYVSTYDREKECKNTLRMLNSKSSMKSFASFFLVNQLIGGNNDKELLPGELTDAYNRHMSVSPRVSDTDLASSESHYSRPLEIDSKTAYKALTKLAAQFGLTPVHGKKTIKNTTKLKIRKKPGFPSVWKLPEQFKQLESLREDDARMKVFESYVKMPEINELICSYYKCIMTTAFDAIRAVDESSLNRLYTSVPVNDKDNPKPSMGEYVKFWVTLRNGLLGLDEKQIEEVAKLFARGIVSTSKLKGYMIGLLGRF